MKNTNNMNAQATNNTTDSKEEMIMKANEMNMNAQATNNTTDSKEEMIMKNTNNMNTEAMNHAHPLNAILEDLLVCILDYDHAEANKYAVMASNHVYIVDEIYNKEEASAEEYNMLHEAADTLGYILDALHGTDYANDPAWTIDLNNIAAYKELEEAAITINYAYTVSDSSTIVIVRTLNESVNDALEALARHAQDAQGALDALDDLFETSWREAFGDEDDEPDEEFVAYLNNEAFKDTDADAFDDPIINYNNPARCSEEYVEQWMEDHAIDSNAVDINNSKEVSIMRTNENKHIDMSNAPVDVREAIDKATYVDSNFEAIFMDMPTQHTLLYVNNKHVGTLPLDFCIVQACECYGCVVSTLSGEVLISFEDNKIALNKALGNLIGLLREFEGSSNDVYSDVIDEAIDTMTKVIEDHEGACVLGAELNLFELVTIVEGYYYSPLNGKITDEQRRLYKSLKQAVIDIIKAY